MAPISEKGHAKNVANFEDLIAFCKGYGTAYNPSKSSIQLSSLELKRTQAFESLKSVNTFIPPWSNAYIARQNIFNPLSKLVTRIYNAVVASDVEPQVISEVKTITRKLQGKRATPIAKTVSQSTENPAEESYKNISASQQGIDDRIAFFDKLIEVLKAQPGYAPNEPELTTPKLVDLHSSMISTNSAVINAYVPLSNARVDRDKILYDEISGLVKITSEVKAYVKSVFGASSPEFKQVRALEFTKIKS
jgi:hypothetical protein